MMQHPGTYEVALSFAGEDRQYAELLASALVSRGVKVFYDDYENANLWGKNLYSHLQDVYLKKAKFCVMFLSHHYISKPWAIHEREAAQACAFAVGTEYILSVRLDDTEIPGILPTVAYLRWPPEDADTIADKIMVKLGRWSEDVPLQFNKARQEVLNLAKKHQSTAVLLSARILTVLYLNRERYKPSSDEGHVLFANLLLQGRGVYHKNRARKADTDTSRDSNAAIGWFWFNGISKEHFMEQVRLAIDHSHIHVRAGAMRALAAFGSLSDKQSILFHINDNGLVAKYAVRSLARLGAAEDLPYLRGLVSDKRAEVRGALAYTLAYKGTGDDTQIIQDLLRDKNPGVRREAVVALGLRALNFPDFASEAICLATRISCSHDEIGQVVAEAKNVVQFLENSSFVPEPSYDKFLRKITLLNDLHNAFTEARSNKAVELLFAKLSQLQEAGILWLINHHPSRIDSILHDHGNILSFRALQRFDYYLFCPLYWRNALEMSDLQQCRQLLALTFSGDR